MGKFAIRDGEGGTKYREMMGEGTLGDPFRTNGIGDANTSSPPLYQYADETGDGTGNYNMAVDGSTTPVTFKVSPPADRIYRIARIIVGVRDAGTFDSGGWGALGGTPLANGFVANVKWSGAVIPLTVQPIKSHFDMSVMCHDLEHHDWGSGDEFATFRFTFTKAGQYIWLDGDADDEIQFIVNDDVTDLVDQRISVQGKQYIKS
jgi:hypothetical protein